MKLLPSLILLGTSVILANAQDVLVDSSDFSAAGGSRPAGWFVANTAGGADAVASSGGLEIRSGSKTEQARNFVIRRFAPVSLEKDGDYIAMSFTLANGDVPLQANNVRFGLFFSKDTALAEDSPQPDPSALRDDMGYYFRLATNPDSDAGNVSRYYVSNGDGQTTALTSNLGRQRQLGDENMTGVLRSNQSRKVELILTRQGESLDFKVLFKGNVQTGGRIIENPPTYTLDEAVFSIVAPDMTVQISGLVIETNAKVAQ